MNMISLYFQNKHNLQIEFRAVAAECPSHRLLFVKMLTTVDKLSKCMLEMQALRGKWQECNESVSKKRMRDEDEHKVQNKEKEETCLRITRDKPSDVKRGMTMRVRD